MLKKIISFFYFNAQLWLKLEYAYKKLEKIGRIKNIYKLKEKLHKIRYNKKKNSFFSSYLKYNLDLDLSLNQFIYSRLINQPIFTSKLMFSISNNRSFIFPLPKNSN